MKLILIAGTFAKRPTWIEDPNHIFRQTMAAEGFELATVDGEPFWWDTEVDGLPIWKSGAWDRAKQKLMRFVMNIPFMDLNVFAHSHGGAVATKTIAALHGLQRFRTLTTIATPRRFDISAEEAVHNVNFWQHIHDNNSDHMATLQRALHRATLGALGDGNASTERKFLLPGVQNIGIDNIDHSQVLGGRIDELRKAGVWQNIRMPIPLDGFR